MKVKLLALTIVGLFGGVLQASTVLSCGWDTTALNSCFSGGLTNFETKLDWAAFGTPDGSVNTGLWTANTGGYNISVSTENTGSGDGMRTAYNFDAVKVGGVWTEPGIAGIPTPYSFPGHFNAVTDNQPSSPMAPDSPYGDHLMGLATDGTPLNSSAPKTLVIDFGGANIADLGFRIAATSNFSFDATVQFFSGANGTGASLGSWTFSGLPNGGVCNTLASTGGSAPVPCNNAYFIGATNFLSNGLGTIHSASISTNDVDGFYVGDLMVTSTPEPTPFVFAGFGLVLLVIGKKKWKRDAQL